MCFLCPMLCGCKKVFLGKRRMLSTLKGSIHPVACSRCNVWPLVHSSRYGVGDGFRHSYCRGEGGTLAGGDVCIYLLSVYLCPLPAAGVHRFTRQMADVKWCTTDFEAIEIHRSSCVSTLIVLLHGVCCSISEVLMLCPLAHLWGCPRGL